MNDRPENKQTKTKDRTGFSQTIGAQASRKIKARQNPSKEVWFGLGMMGLIGWSVVVPTLLGTALGIWIDKHHPGSHSWTLMLLIIGLFIGCLNAWHWVDKEDKKMREQQEDNDNE